MVREYKGSHSGEHGDGIVRSEFHEAMFGSRLTRAFEEVKQRFDPAGTLNPGKIVHAPRMDDRSLFRYPADYRPTEIKTVLDWSAYSGASGGFQGAIEMCNNNGACRRLEGGVMCPSFRATHDEKDVTRGRANTLRLAMTGQLGADALASDEVMDALKLCVSCKACRNECPTGVDMAKMKIEVLAARADKFGLSMRDRLIAFLPRYASLAARTAPLANLRNRSRLLRRLFEAFAGISRKRDLPEWRSDVFEPTTEALGPVDGVEVVLFADTFNRAYERENLDAALNVLVEAGYRVHLPRPAKGSRALCCGRTFLSRRAGRSCTGGTRPDRRNVCALRRARRSHHRAGAQLPAHAARRASVAAQRRRRKIDCGTGRAVRGISGARGRRRPIKAAASPAEEEGAAAWPLPSEVFRRVQARREGAAAYSRSRGANRRVRAAAAWPARSVMVPTRSRRRWRWPRSRCCLRSGSRMPTT